MKITTEERFHSHVRALRIRGEHVSSLGIQDFTIRMGPAQFKMGGIGGVQTHWQHRKKGYARRVMLDSLRWMNSQGYDLTMLYGIENFYHKFGYANCSPEVTSTVRTRDAEQALKEARGFTIRPLVDSDWPRVLSLYNRNNAARPLAVVRMRKAFRGIRHGSSFKISADGFVIERRGGKFAGYLIVDRLPAATTLCELETNSPDAMRAALAELVRIAIARRDGEIVAQLPSDHPFTAYLRRFGSKLTATYRNTGAIMGRFINQDHVLGKLISAYSASRPKAARALPAHVIFKTDLGTTRLTIPRAIPSRAARIEIPSMTLLQLLTGFRTADEALLSPHVTANGAAADVLRFLSPDLEPCMYSVDHF